MMYPTTHSPMIHFTMPTINNADLTRELIDGAKIQLSYDDVPGRLAQAVVPTMEVNPGFLRKDKVLFQQTSSLTGTKSGGTSNNKKTYVTGFNFSYIKDVTCNSATGDYTLKGTKDGKAVVFCALPVITLLAQEGSMSQTFKNPILVDKATSLQCTGGFTAGVCVRSFSFFGYEVED